MRALTRNLFGELVGLSCQPVETGRERNTIMLKDYIL